jgi:predicted Fe-Mo cluster-binding NifX family protein
MRIAIPTANGRLSKHFGHCEEFVLLDMDTQKKCVLRTQTVKAPAHQPGLLPQWLAERGVNVVIAGGMGARAQQHFASKGIRLALGASSEAPEILAAAYVGETLETGPNVCDH